MSYYPHDDEDGPEQAPKTSFWDHVRFVPLATHKRLQDRLDAVEASHVESHRRAVETIRQVAAERDELRRALEQARMTPQTKADTEAAYARGLLAGSRDFARRFLGQTLPQYEMSARKLSKIARDLANPDPGHDPHADETTDKENDK